MADNYDVLASTFVDELVAPNLTLQAQEVTARAKPSGVIFPVRVPIVDPLLFSGDALAELVREQVDSVATIVNDYAQAPGFVGMQVFQDVTVANQLQDKEVVTVSSTSGRSTTTIERNFLGQDPQEFAAMVAEARHGLDLIEGL